MSAAVDHRHVERILKAQVRLRPDRPQERPSLVVTARQQVLAVVHTVAGSGVTVGERTPTGVRTRFEYQDAQSGGGQSDRGGQPGEPGADDDGIEGHVER